MTSKIKTYCRFHSLSKEETIYEIYPSLTAFTIENTKICYKNCSMETSKPQYNFDKVFNETSQNEIFQEILKPIIKDAFISSKFLFFF